MRRVTWLFFLIFLFISACSKDNQTNKNQLPVTTAEFNVTVKSVIDYYSFDANGNLNYNKTETYTYPGYIFIDDPVHVKSVTEENPFNLIICNDNTSGIAKAGDFFMCSAAVLDTDVGKVLLPFWEFTYNNGTISGKLVKNGLDESCALFNSIFAEDEESIPGVPMIIMYVMEEQTTTMSGTLTNNTADICIQGESTNKVRKFKTTIQTH